MNERGPVVVRIFVEARPSEETVEWSREEWDAMTPAQRRESLNVALDVAVANAGDAGYELLNRDDEQDLED